MENTLSSENIPFYPFYADNTGIHFEIIPKTGDDLNHTNQFSTHRHKFMEIIWVTKHSSIQIVDYKMYEVKENEVLIIPENSTHYEKNQPYEGFVFLFTYDFFNSEQAQLLQSFSILDVFTQNRLLKIDEQSHVIALLNNIIQEYAIKPYPFYMLSLQSLLFTLLIKLENIKQVQVGYSLPLNKEGKIYRNFILLLEDHYKKQLTANFYAKELNMTLKKLNQALDIAIGKTTSEVIFERVMLEAKRYLSYSHKSIKEIAFELGFEDSHYFSRIFKKKTTFTPKEFREKYAVKSI